MILILELLLQIDFCCFGFPTWVVAYVLVILAAELWSSSLCITSHQTNFIQNVMFGFVFFLNTKPPLLVCSTRLSVPHLPRIPLLVLGTSLLPLLMVSPCLYFSFSPILPLDWSWCCICSKRFLGGVVFLPIYSLCISFFSPFFL